MIRHILPTLSLLTLSLASPVQAQAELTGKAAIDHAVGNTMVTRLVDETVGAQEGRLLLRPDGTAVWVNIEPGAQAVTIRWQVDDQGQLCMSGFPADTVEDSCAGISITGDKVVMHDGDSDSAGILDITLVPGNPGNL
ncbi:hypothetical protein GRI97_07080 [Altererythrobacter xixiisoli]|uniref:Uncharacterized protein n=1 Tax=Croceibacterium xixiisoli TaxID=1476466 RepID=A0A6I4TRH2_9SPHN|nr:hypothetical protein [Croceibacterium xixiisoli]MXO98745.1 hypothetical protein [Croceibacterium xixiisoli]